MLRIKIPVLVSLSVSFCLLLSQTSAATVEPALSQTPVYGNAGQMKTNISKAEAIKIISSFKFTKDLKISDVYLENSRELNQPVWKLDSHLSGYSNDWGLSISANTGELLNYYSYPSAAGNKNIIKVGKKKAKEAADKFLADYVKTGLEDLDYPVTNSYPISGGITGIPVYQFTYALKINGIRTNNIHYTVSVNGMDGTVTYFSSPYYGYIKETKYPSADGIRNQTQLRDRYMSSFAMQLQYRIIYDDNYNPRARLDYIPATAGWLNAKTLDFVDTDYINYYGNTASLSNKYAPINPSAKIKNNEISKYGALEILKNAKAYIEGLCGFKFDSNPNLSRPLEDRKFFSGYSLNSDNKYYSLSMSMNLNTGNITELDFTCQVFDSNNSEEKKVLENVVYKDAKKISDSMIKKLFPKQYGVFSDNNRQPAASNSVKEQRNHIFQYVRYENGIPTDNSILVYIDKETGMPVSVSMRWNDIDFTKPDNIISQQAAKEAFLNYVPFSLEYYTPQINRNEFPDKPEDAIIVFKPDDSAMNTFIAAATGEIVDYYGTPLKVPHVGDNHWAADEIDMLEAQGVSSHSISDCDEKLSRQDAVKMLSQALHIMGTKYFDENSLKENSFSDIDKDNEYYKYVETSIKNGIIKATGKKFNGADKITKGEYIVMLLDMLGYKETIRNNKTSSGTDIDAYISKCRSLDILPVKPGDNFNDKDFIRFSEAAYSLQKALKFL